MTNELQPQPSAPVRQTATPRNQAYTPAPMFTQQQKTLLIVAGVLAGGLILWKTVGRKRRA